MLLSLYRQFLAEPKENYSISRENMKTAPLTEAMKNKNEQTSIFNIHPSITKSIQLNYDQ